MPILEYEKALKLGKKDYQQRIARGEKPTLQVLDDILPSKGTYAEVPIGLVQIPIEQIVGTKTNGRSNAFAGNFMPLLEKGTEFSSKWINLSIHQENDGIQDPIKVYEYMNRFYVEEGNKRVSVLKYYGAVSILGNVIRLIPPRTNDLENKIYFEFLDFYELNQINYLWFSKEGSFAKLQELVGKSPNETWTEDDCLDFASLYYRFKNIYEKQYLNPDITTGDAFLTFIDLHGYDSLLDKYADELETLIAGTWEELNLLGKEDGIELLLAPTEKKSLLGKLHLYSIEKLKIAFIYEKSPTTSAWTYGHELGRLHLEQAFENEIETVCYENVTTKNITRTIQKAVKDGCNLIFTTTPTFAQASVKAAIKYPTVRILNCSVNTSHRYIRTYYIRTQKAKFLMGAIAGAMAENDKITYIADYPLYGTIADINAFALGAKMINPRAKVYLDWRSIKGNDVLANIKKTGSTCVSSRDMVFPDEDTRYFGIYYMDNGKPRNLAMPLMHWGKFYEKLIHTILDGSWSYDTAATDKAINYWWGMSAGVIDVICSRNLPIGTKRLIELLKSTMMSGEFNPFTGVLYSQDGIAQSDPNYSLTPEEIVNMDWLAENVIGHIPTKDELIDSAIPVYLQQGIEIKE